MMRSSALSLALSYVALGIGGAGAVRSTAVVRMAGDDSRRQDRNPAGRCAAPHRRIPARRRRWAEELHRCPRPHADRGRANPAADRCARCIRSPATCTHGPSSVPATPGNYTIHVNMGTHGEQTALVHVALLGSNNLLVGRDNLLFKPLQTFFWYGLTRRGRRAVHRRIVRRPHHAPRVDVADSQHPPHRIGHHPRRPQAPTADPFER